MLGMVLTPYGRLPNAYPFQIDRSGPDYRPHLKPFDPYYNQRGEQGFYYDAFLGLPQLGTATAGPQFRDAGLTTAPQRRKFPAAIAAAATQKALQGPQLGALPTDAEMGQNLCYTPVHSGWIRTQDGYMAPPWTPGYGPGPGLGADTIQVEDKEKWPRRMFYLSVASTIAVVAVSAVNLYRASKAIRRGTL